MRKAFLFLLALIFFMTLSNFFTIVCNANAESNSKAALGIGKEKIQVLSDRLEGNYNSQEVTFMGNVVCKQGERVLVSDLLRIKYKNSTSSVNGSRQLDNMEAVGGVRFFYGTKLLTGTNATFYNDEQKLIVTGEPTMWDGKNYIRGTRIVFYLATEEGVVEGDIKQRVSAIVYPEDDTKQKARREK